MRGIAAVLTLAFVFASSALLVGPASAQGSSEPSPMPPEEYRQEPTDAVLHGRVLDQKGAPVAAAVVSSYNHGPIMYAEGDVAYDSSGTTTTTSGTAGPSSPSRSYYYGGNSTTTAADGSYRLGVYSGENSVSVYRDGYASSYVQVSVGSGQTVAQDLTVQKFPDKTARIEGRITDARTGRGIPTASVSVNSPVYGAYECSMRDSEQPSGSGGGAKPMPASEPGSNSSGIVAPDYWPGCAITVHDDGRFEGLVTPGYSTVSVYAYGECAMTSDADGSTSSDCGPQYYNFVRTLDLPANKTTVVNVALRSHPAPDAVVSGYLIDAESGNAIPGAQISFSNQQAYGYGWATTDGDGSYSIRLRSGYHQVSVYAPGHLPWEGNLDVKAGDSDFDVELTPGEASYGGGCCYAYDRAVVATSGTSGPTTAGAVAPMPANGAEGAQGLAQDSADSDEAAAGGSQEVLYEDLGGGLGPYDAGERQDALAEAEDGSGGGLDIPSPGVLLAVAALGAVLLVRRRLA